MPSQIEGGIYHPEIPNKRASATFEVNVDKEEITVLTSSEQTFTFDLDDAELDMAGATGKMLFIKFEGGKITLFSESPALLDALRRTILERQVQQVMEAKKRSDRNGWMLWGVLIAGVLIVGLGLFASIQSLSSRLVGFIPIEADIKLGEYVGPTMDKDGPEVTDTAIVEPVQQIVTQITANIEEEWNFDVHVIDADIQNAFALPGGYIVVYTGLIKDTERPEQLAGVLAHEIAHVTRRHGMARILEAAGVAIAVDMLLGNVEGMIAFGAEIFSASAVNAYSRDSETDADVEGLKLLVDAGIDPNGMVEFFQVMEQEEDELTEMMPLWMRSHPEHEQRILVLQAQIGALPVQTYQPLEMDWGAVKSELGVDVEEDVTP